MAHTVTRKLEATYKRKISGACGSFVLCLDHVVIVVKIRTHWKAIRVHWNISQVGSNTSSNEVIRSLCTRAHGS